MLLLLLLPLLLLILTSPPPLPLLPLLLQLLLLQLLLLLLQQLLLLPLTLQHDRKNIRKETNWMISNIVAGTPLQLMTVMKVDGILPRVLKCFSDSEHYDVRKEAAWVIDNIISSGNYAQRTSLVELG